jgi:cell division protease FtsH
MQHPNDHKSNDNKPPQDPNQPPEQQPPDWQRWVAPGLLILILVWMVAQFGGFGMFGATEIEVRYSDLLDEAERGNVSEITIRGDSASGKFRQPVSVEVQSGSRITSESVTEFSLNLPQPGDQAQLIETLQTVDNPPDIQFESTETSVMLIVIAQYLPIVIIVGLLIWLARRTQRQMNGAMGFGKTQAREYDVERPQVTFDDVAGQDSAKMELTEIVDFLKEPDKYIALGARIPRGVLLIGPPGTGKTLMARAVAGEASVSFFSITASEFVEMFVGVGASRVRDLFKRAKDNSPSIVFIDELDAVGRRRGAGLGGSHDEREQTLNQMLAEMDGFDQNESVIVLAATNRNDVLDPALLRPGRFDRQVTVGLPDRLGRLAILKIHTRGKPLATDVKLEKLARGTIGFSGADLANLANEAALNAARRNAKKISMRDFSDAFDRLLLGTESPPLSNPQERKVVAYHEAGHTLIAAMTPGADPVLKVTIVPRGSALGITAQMPNDDRRNYSEQYLLVRLLVLLGGRAAEKVMFNEVTTGAENDLRVVTALARRMVAQFGMSEALGQLNFGTEDNQPFLGYSISQGRTYSEETAAKIDSEVRRIIDEAYAKTLAIIEEHKDKLVELANALLENEVLEQDEILEILDLDLEDVLPDDEEKAELMRRHSQKSSHFSLNVRTDADILADDEDDAEEEAPEAEPEETDAPAQTENSID